MSKKIALIQDLFFIFINFPTIRALQMFQTEELFVKNINNIKFVTPKV